MAVTLAFDFTKKKDEELEEQAKELANALLQLESIRRQPQKARFQLQSIGGQPFLTDLPERFSNPADVIVKELMTKAPDLGLKFLPELISQVREIGDIEQAYSQISQQLETLKKILPEQDVELVKQVITQNPQKAGELITSLILNPVLAKAEAFAKGKAELEFAKSPEGQELYKLDLRRKLEELEARADIEIRKALTLTRKQLELETQFKLPEQIREYREEIAKSIMRLADKYLERYDKLQSRYDNLIEDIEVAEGLKEVNLPDGGNVSPAQLLSSMKSAKSLKDALATLGIPATEDNITTVRTIIERYRQNPEKLRKVTEVYDIQNKLSDLSKGIDYIQKHYDELRQLLPDLPDIKFDSLKSLGITDISKAIDKKLSKSIPSQPNERVDNKIAETVVNLTESLANIFKPVKEVTEKLSKSSELTRKSPDDRVIANFIERIRKTNKIIDEEATLTAVENILQRELTESEKMNLITEIRKRNRQLFYLE